MSSSATVISSVDAKQFLIAHFQQENLDPLIIDGLYYAYCFDFPALKCAKKWFEEEFPEIESGATPASLAWVKRVKAQIDRIYAFKPWIPQGNIHIALGEFYKTFPGDKKGKPEPRSEKLLEEVKKGQCSGYAGVVGYGLFLKKEPVRLDEKQVPIPRDDWDTIEKALKKMSSYTKDTVVTMQERQEIERIFGLIHGMQQGRELPINSWQGEWHERLVDTRGRQFKRLYSIGGPLIAEDLDLILSLLLKKDDKTLKNPRIFLMTSHNHDVSLVQYAEKDAQWVFYDSNNFIGPIEVDDFEGLRKLIYLANEFKDTVPTPGTIKRNLSPVGLRIVGVDDETDYPKQEEILKQIWAVKNKRLDDYDTGYCKGHNCFGIAAHIGCMASLEFFLKEGATLKFPAGANLRKETVAALIKFNTAPTWLRPYVLHEAVQNHDIDMVELLIKYDKNYLNEKNKEEETPLQVAVQLGFFLMVDALLKAKAEVQHKNKKGQTAFQMALDAKNVAVVSVFREHGVADQWDAMGFTPLHHAASLGDIEKVQVLVDAGVNVFAETKHNSLMAIDLTVSPKIKMLLMDGMFKKVVPSQNLAALKKLLQAGNPISVAVLNTNRIVLVATETRDLSLMRELINRKVNLNVVGQGGVTALHIAAKNNDLPMVRLLLEGGANVLATQSDGKTAANLATHPAVHQVLKESVRDKLMLMRVEKEGMSDETCVCWTMTRHQKQINSANLLLRFLNNEVKQEELTKHKDALSEGSVGDYYREVKKLVV